jgi:transcriptional regulator with XRE-family HTH domain
LKKLSAASKDRRGFIARLQQSRRAAHFSQSEMARKLGVTPSAVAQWEHPNGTSPSFDRLVSIARSTSVNIEWLATGRGERHNKGMGGEQITAISLDFYAQDEIEETLLAEFRLLPQAAKRPLLQIIKLIRKAGTY